MSDRTGWEPRPLRLDGKYPDERTRWPENSDYWNQVQVHRAASWWYWIDGQRFAVNLTTIGEPDIAGVQHPVGRVARALPVRHDGGPLLTSLFWWEGQ